MDVTRGSRETENLDSLRIICTKMSKLQCFLLWSLRSQVMVISHLRLLFEGIPETFISKPVCVPIIHEF